MLYTTVSQSTVECFISQQMSATPPEPNYNAGNLHTFDIIGSSWMLVAEQSDVICIIIIANFQCYRLPFASWKPILHLTHIHLSQILI
jgi:hypothetical protein